MQKNSITISESRVTYCGAMCWSNAYIGHHCRQGGPSSGVPINAEEFYNNL